MAVCWASTDKPANKIEALIIAKDSFVVLMRIQFPWVLHLSSDNQNDSSKSLPKKQPKSIYIRCHDAIKELSGFLPVVLPLPHLCLINQDVAHGPSCHARHSSPRPFQS